MYINRALEDILVGLTRAFPVVVLCGARQVGKTTLLQKVFPQTDSVVFDPHIDIGNARADPDLFLETRGCPLILDEIQYSPQVVSAIKRRVDRSRKPGMYLLTGSQQWAVMKSMAESLAGRAVILDLQGFSRAEARGHPSDNWLKTWLGHQTFEAPSPAGHRGIPDRNVFEQIWRGWGVCVSQTPFGTASPGTARPPGAPRHAPPGAVRGCKRPLPASCGSASASDFPGRAEHSVLLAKLSRDLHRAGSPPVFRPR